MIETRVKTFSFSFIMCKIHHDKRMNESTIKKPRTRSDRKDQKHSSEDLRMRQLIMLTI